MNGIDLNEIIERCKKQDRKAQQWLFQQYAGIMMALCYRYTGRADDAQDVLQDGFVKVFMKLDKYSGTGSFEGWMKRIMVNTALEWLRKKDHLRNALTVEDQLDVSQHEPDALSKMTHQELLDAVAKLPAGFRTVFNMYAIEGYNHKEIGEVLGISSGTSKSQYARARAQLMKMVKQKEVYA